MAAPFAYRTTWMCNLKRIEVLHYGITRALFISSHGSRKCERVNSILKSNTLPVSSMCLYNSNESSLQPFSTSKPQKFYSVKSHDSSQKELIYKGPLAPSIKMLKCLSLSTSLCGLLLVQRLFQAEGFGTFEIAMSGFVLFFVSTPLLLHWFTKSYVTELYYDEKADSYEAYTVNFILMRMRHVFRQDQVELPPVKNVFTSFLGNKRGFMVDPRNFVPHHDFNKLLGYDKLPKGVSEEEMKKLLKNWKDDDEED